MPEILTESFCERCGTRYTFQSSAPKVGRLAKMKVLSRGLKNYVLSDETSLDEALADARGVDDREHSVEQLDAFHKTFNFCMSCRQYTCANCWNDREGRCLSCAPSLSVGLLPSSLPALSPVSGIAGLGGNGHGLGAGNGNLEEGSAWPESDLGIASDEGTPFVGAEAVEEKPLSRLEALFGREAAARIEAGAPKGPEIIPQITSVPEMIGHEKVQPKEHAPEMIGMEAQASDEAESALVLVDDEPALEGALESDAVVAAGTAEELEAEDEVAAELEDEVAAAIAATSEEADEPKDEIAAGATLAPEPIRIHPIDPETDELAAAAAAQTHGLLDKFRAKPDPVAAPRSILPTPAVPYETPPPVPYVAPAAAPTAPAAPQLPYAAVGPQQVPSIPQPFGVIGRPPSSTPGTQPYGSQVAMPYAAGAGQPASQPYRPPASPAYPSQDAPIQPYPAPTSSQPAPPPAMYPPFQPEYASAPPQPQNPAPPQQYAPPQPQYAPPPPPAPSWRMVAPESPFLAPAPGNGHIGTAPSPSNASEPEWPTTPSWPAPLARGAEAVWAESTRDLLSRPEAGVSACFNCGLPLSATARFCRRCGTNQVAS
jgi:hypothetical protein